MKKLLLMFILLFVTTSLHADWPTHGMTIPTTYPRLWFNSARLVQSQIWLTTHPFTPGTCNSGNPNNCFDVAWKHAVAGTDCTPAINWVMNTASIPFSQWQPGHAGSNYTRWWGEVAAVTHDWCHDQFTTQQLADFIHNIAGSGYGWQDYLTGINQQSWGRPAMVQNNYNLGNMRNDIEFGITLYGEAGSGIGSFPEALLNDGIDVRFTQYFLPTTTTTDRGGAAAEGSEYGIVWAAYPIIPFQTAQLLGRDLYNASGYFKQFVYWTIYSTSPVPVLNKKSGDYFYMLNPFSDDEHFIDGDDIHTASGYEDFMNFASNYWSGTNVGKFARQWWNTVGAYRGNGGPWPDTGSHATDAWILAVDNNATVLPLDYYATGLQYFYGRRDYAGSTTFMFQMGDAVELGQGGLHAHYDYGNFNIQRNGKWLSRETTQYSNTVAGYGYRGFSPTSGNTMVAHNTIVFGTPLGRDDVFMMPSIKDGMAIVRRLASTPYYSYADVDLTPEYLWDHSNVYIAPLNRGAVGHIETEKIYLRPLDTFIFATRITTNDVLKGTDSAKGYNGSSSGYSADTATFTNGSTVVTRTGANYVPWKLEWSGHGYTITCNASPCAGQTATVDSFSDGYTANLTAPWSGTSSGTNVDYNIHSNVCGVFCSAASEVNTFILHSETNPILEDASHYSFVNLDQTLRITSLVPATPVRRVINEQACTGCSLNIGQYRVEEDTSGNAQRYFIHVLQARDTTAANLAASVIDSNPTDPNTGTFTITVDVCSVIINKGQTSIGGTINCTGPGGGNWALRPDMQDINYYDTGVFWGQIR